MALDLEIRITDRETGTPTELFTSFDITSDELGMLHMLMEHMQFGTEITIDTVRG